MATYLWGVAWRPGIDPAIVIGVLDEGTIHEGLNAEQDSASWLQRVAVMAFDDSSFDVGDLRHKRRAKAPSKPLAPHELGCPDKCSSSSSPCGIPTPPGPRIEGEAPISNQGANFSLKRGQSGG